MTVVVSLFAWCVWNKRFPVVTVVSAFLTMTIVGFLNRHLELRASRTPYRHRGNPWMLCVAGLIVDAYASALIVMSVFGIRNMDLLAITFVQTLRWPFIAAKTLFEIAFVVIAWITHGPVGVAMVLFVVIVGSLIQPFMTWSTMMFRLPKLRHGSKLLQDCGERANVADRRSVPEWGGSLGRNAAAANEPSSGLGTGNLLRKQEPAGR